MTIRRKEQTELEEETVESPAEQEIADSGTRRGIIVNSPIVSVKVCASDWSPVKDYLRQGDSVTIVEELESGFFLIQYGKTNRVGFVSSNCCKGV